MNTEKYDSEKLKDAMHYVIAHVQSRPGFGAVKLYKVLWFSEARSFLLFNRPMFNAPFIREKNGPVPKHGIQLREELVGEGRIRAWKDRWHNRQIWRFQSLKPPSTARFSAEELRTLGYWIKHIDEDHTAESISEQSHDYGWEIAKMGEVLPLHACIASRIREPNEAELSRARQRMGYLL
jgi:hypothetical protein